MAGVERSEKLHLPTIHSHRAPGAPGFTGGLLFAAYELDGSIDLPQPDLAFRAQGFSPDDCGQK
jgi:hypothetical protein